MPLDDRLRTGLRGIADRVDPDVEGGFQHATSARPPSAVRRAGVAIAYVAAVGLGIAVIGLGKAALFNEVGTSPSPAASSSPLASTCPSPGTGTCAGALAPGNYRSDLFIPPINYLIPDGAPAWDKPEDLPGTFTLHPAGPRTDAIFFFRDVRVYTEGCDPVFDESVGNSAADIAAWMASNPGILSTTVEPMTLGGLRGVVLDIAASGTYTTVCPNDQETYAPGLPILPLFGGAGSGDLTWFIGGDERMRLYLLDMPGGGNVVISIDAIGGDFDTLLETTQPVIHGITFDPAYY